MTGPVETPPIEISFAWNDWRLEYRTRYFHLPRIEQAERGPDLAILLMGLGLVALVGVVYAMEVTETLPPGVTPPFLFGILSGVGAAGIVSYRLLRKWFGDLFDAEATDREALKSAPVERVVLDSTGVTIEAPNETTCFTWHAIRTIEEPEAAIVLRMGPQRGIFLFDDLLPDTISRAALLRQCKLWRGPW